MYKSATKILWVKDTLLFLLPVHVVDGDIVYEQLVLLWSYDE